MILAVILAVTARPDSLVRAAEYRGVDGRIHFIVPRIDTTITVDGSVTKLKATESGELVHISGITLDPLGYNGTIKYVQVQLREDVDIRAAVEGFEDEGDAGCMNTLAAP